MRYRIISKSTLEKVYRAACATRHWEEKPSHMSWRDYYECEANRTGWSDNELEAAVCEVLHAPCYPLPRQRPATGFVFNFDGTLEDIASAQVADPEDNDDYPRYIAEFHKWAQQSRMVTPA